MAAMVALGELPPVDFAIHSDTTWERSSTYAFAKQWTPWLEDLGVKVVTVSDAKIAGAVVVNHGGLFIPAYTLAENGDRGALRRQCTGRWKITPVRRYIAASLKENEQRKTPGIVEQWIGYTLDEWRRMSDSKVKYIVNKFPLIDMNYTRADCLSWLDKNGLPSPGKSACTFCPFHSKLVWQQMKRKNGPDWNQAVEVDEKIRDKRPPYPLFVHPARVPLPEAVVIPEDFGATQLSFLESDDYDAECDSGYCFL